MSSPTAHPREQVHAEIRRVIAEWPAAAGVARQPRLREIAEQLNQEAITSSRGRPWNEQLLLSCMKYHGISINEILPSLPAFARTRSDNERIRREEEDQGIERNNQSWSRHADPPTRSMRLIRVEATLTLINEFFSVRRSLGCLTGGEPSPYPVPRAWQYNHFPFGELCAYLNARNDCGPTGVPWQVQNLRRFIERSFLNTFLILERYAANAATMMSALTIPSESDVVILPAEMQRALGLAIDRMETRPLVPVTLDADGAR